MTGFVPDEELERLYARAGLAIAPLRYGGGVKGKVVEAFRQGVPIVTTAAGVQGLEGLGGACAVADDADAFAEAAAALLADPARWRAQAQAGAAYLARRFATARAREVFALDVPELAAAGRRTVELEIRHIGVGGSEDGDARIVDLGRAGDDARHVYHDAIVDRSGYAAACRATLASLRQPAPPGALLLETRDAVVFGRYGLAGSASGVFRVDGQAVWATSNIEGFSQACGGRPSADGTRIAFDFDPAEAAALPEGAFLMSGPGQDTFGHWHLDFLPRMRVARRLGEARPRFAFLAPLPGFARELLDLAGYAPDQLVVMAERPAWTARLLRQPLTIKRGNEVNVAILREAMDELVAGAYRRYGLAPAKRRRLYLSRDGWAHAKPLADAEALRDLLVRRFGFEEIRPHALPLAEQIAILSQAEMIVGEDGSALHNAVFAPEGIPIGALMRVERDNLWHAAFCAAKDQTLHLSKMAGDPERPSVDLADVAAMVQAMAS